MSDTGVDELEVGRPPRRPPPWHGWSRRTRGLAVAAGVVLVLGGGVAVVVAGRDPAPSPVAAAVDDDAPGADVAVDIGVDRSKCPPGATCRFAQSVTDPVEAAFRRAFGSAGYIGRQGVVDARTGAVYYQYIRFATGNLVTVELTVQATAGLAAPPVVHPSPDPNELANGGVRLSVVRDGFVVTGSAAGLPGQAIPVASVREWVTSVPLP